MTWRQMSTEAWRSAGPTKADKSAAMKEAGRRWQAMKRGGEHRENPSNDGVGTLVIVGAAIAGGIYVWKQNQKKAQAAAAAAATKPAAPASPSYVGV